MTQRSSAVAALRNPKLTAERNELLEQMTPATRALAEDLLANHVIKNQLSTIEHAHAVGRALVKARNDQAKYGDNAIIQIAEYLDLPDGRNRLFQMVRLSEVWTLDAIKNQIKISSEAGFSGLTMTHFYLLTDVSSETKRQKLLDKSIKNHLSARELQAEISGGASGGGGRSGGQGRKITPPKSLPVAFVKVGKTAQHLTNLVTAVDSMIDGADVDAIGSVEELATIQQRSREARESLNGLKQVIDGQIARMDELDQKTQNRINAGVAKGSVADEEEEDAIEVEGKTTEAIGGEAEYSTDDDFEAPPAAKKKKVVKKIVKRVVKKVVKKRAAAAAR